MRGQKCRKNQNVEGTTVLLHRVRHAGLWIEVFLKLLRTYGYFWGILISYSRSPWKQLLPSLSKTSPSSSSPIFRTHQRLLVIKFPNGNCPLTPKCGRKAIFLELTVNLCSMFKNTKMKRYIPLRHFLSLYCSIHRKAKIWEWISRNERKL